MLTSLLIGISIDVIQILALMYVFLSEALFRFRPSFSRGA